MSNVLNRTTKVYLASVNEPDYPIAQWIWSPDLSAVTGFNSRYWTITGDIVTLMAPAQRTAVDTANLSAARDAAVSEVDQVENILRAFLLVLLDELNAHALKMTAIMNAVDSSTTYATLKSNIVAIADYPQRTTAQLRASIRGKLGT